MIFANDMLWNYDIQLGSDFHVLHMSVIIEVAFIFENFELDLELCYCCLTAGNVFS